MARTLPTTLGKVNGHRVEFTPTHREDNPTPVVTTMVLAVPMSIEDITAALMYITNGSSDADVADWLADDTAVRQSVMETVFGLGGHELGRERLAVASIDPDGPDGERLAMVRACSVRVFAPSHPVPAPRMSPEAA